MKSSSQGTRASVRYTSDPGQEMAEPPSPEECKSHTRNKQKSKEGCDGALPQTKALLDNEKTTIEPDSQVSMEGMIHLIPLQPASQSTSVKE